MNVQVAANLGGQIAAIGPIAVHGARHDAHAFAASGLKQLLADIPAIGDLGYVGVDGITIVPDQTSPRATSVTVTRNSTPRWPDSGHSTNRPSQH